jgi:hypothetical protein
MHQSQSLVGHALCSIPSGQYCNNDHHLLVGPLQLALVEGPQESLQGYCQVDVLAVEAIFVVCKCLGWGQLGKLPLLQR